jgi:hypothetical protein
VVKVEFAGVCGSEVHGLESAIATTPSRCAFDHEGVGVPVDLCEVVAPVYGRMILGRVAAVYDRWREVDTTGWASARAAYANDSPSPLGSNGRRPALDQLAESVLAEGSASRPARARNARRRALMAAGKNHKLGGQWPPG